MTAATTKERKRQTENKGDNRLAPQYELQDTVKPEDSDRKR